MAFGKTEARERLQLRVDLLCGVTGDAAFGHPGQEPRAHPLHARLAALGRRYAACGGRGIRQAKGSWRLNPSVVGRGRVEQNEVRLEAGEGVRLFRLNLSPLTLRA